VDENAVAPDWQRFSEVLQRLARKRLIHVREEKPKSIDCTIDESGDDPRALGKTVHRAELGARKGRYFRMFAECATSVRSFVAVNFPSNAIRRAWETKQRSHNFTEKQKIWVGRAMIALALLCGSYFVIDIIRTLRMIYAS
jgi:hypothetical protein